MQLFPELDTPALCIDLDRMERNLEEMAAAAKAHGVGLRPHIKSHKLAEIMYQQASQQGGGQAGGQGGDTGAAGASAGASGGDDVIDADFVDVDDKK